MSNAPKTPWPELPTAAWRDTYATLHLWTQVIGKIRLVRTPWQNHSWHVALYVSARGLTTSPIPDGNRTFQIDLDFIGHALRITTSDGAQRQFALAGPSVASFYAAVMAALAEFSIDVTSTRYPTNCRIRCGSRKTASTPPTIRMPWSASSKYWSTSTGY